MTSNADYGAVSTDNLRYARLWRVIEIECTKCGEIVGRAWGREAAWLTFAEHFATKHLPPNDGSGA